MIEYAAKNVSIWFTRGVIASAVYVILLTLFQFMNELSALLFFIAICCVTLICVLCLFVFVIQFVFTACACLFGVGWNDKCIPSKQAKSCIFKEGITYDSSTKKYHYWKAPFMRKYVEGYVND